MSSFLYLKMAENRISFEEYGLRLAEVAAQRSEDPRTKVGCVLFRHDGTIASLGYNGAPSGVEMTCWDNRKEKILRVIHAEINSLRHVKPGECYMAAVTYSPCNDCLKSLAAYGIKKIVYRNEYRPNIPYPMKTIAKEFGIELQQITCPCEAS